MSGGQRTEVVRGRIDPDLRRRLLDFWDRHRALDPATAETRLEEVVCVRVDGEGAIVGINSAYPDLAPLVGLRLWIYRRFLSAQADADAERDMLEAAVAEFQRNFGDNPDEPIGICVLVREPGFIARFRDAVWSATGLFYAGYTQGGTQVRIRYFDGARLR